MKKKILWILICVLIVIVLLICSLFMYHKNQNSDKNYVVFENKSFEVELATTSDERQKWLMYREFLDEDKWMLFVFENEWHYNFWMKNTLIPLDMIWINDTNGENRVVDIQTAHPCEVKDCPSYTPRGNAVYVLEINAWLAKKYDIKFWDLLYLK